MKKISIISMIAFSLLLTFTRLNAQYIEQTGGDTINVVQGDKTYPLPRAIALQAKTFNEAYGSLGSDQPIHIPSPLLSEGQRINMETISTLMQLFDKHKTLSGKALLDAVEQELVTIDLNNDLLQQCGGYLRFTPGIHLIARHIARNCSADEAAQLPYSQLKKVAQYYFLLHGENLSCIDPKKIGFSLNDYKDYRPDDIIKNNQLIPDLRNLRLKKLHADCFIDLKYPDFINLSYNQLTMLNPNSLKGLTHLTQLGLDHNKLRKLYPETFQALNNLKILFLQSNQLNELYPTTFSGLNNLTHINLASNQLSELDPKIFQGLPNLETLVLDRNPLSPENIQLLKDSLPHVKIST